jgi:beta-galactosidase
LGGRIDAQVALVWDWENHWYQQASIGPVAELSARDGIRDWHGTLFERGLVADIRHPEHDLTGYRVIIVPSLMRLTTAAAARLREAVAAGAHLIVTYLTGWADDKGHAVLGGYLGPLADVLGVRVIEATPSGVTPVLHGAGEAVDPLMDRVSATVVAPAKFSEIGLMDADGAVWRGIGLRWSEELAIDDESVEVLTRYADQPPTDLEGHPAIMRLPGSGTGRGDAWYVATAPDGEGRDTLLARVLADAGVVTPGLPAGVVRTTRGNATFWFNHGDWPVDVDGRAVPARGVVVERA